MTLLVDTSVWSLALRRDGLVEATEVIALREALYGADTVVTRTTGLVLQELLQGPGLCQCSATCALQVMGHCVKSPDRLTLVVSEGQASTQWGHTGRQRSNVGWLPV